MNLSIPHAPFPLPDPHPPRLSAGVLDVQMPWRFWEQGRCGWTVRCTSAALLSLLAAACSAAIDFTRSAVNLPASTTAFEYQYDLDGDGRRDLLAIYQRRVMIFFQNDASGYSSAPDVEIGSQEPIPSIYTQVSVGKVSDDPGQQLIFYGPEGVDYLSLAPLRNNPEAAVEPRPLISRKLNITSGPMLDFTNAATDLDGDGRTDLVVPVAGAFEIYMADADGKFASKGKVPLQIRTNQTTRLDPEPELLGSADFGGLGTGQVQSLPAADRWHSVQYAISSAATPMIFIDYNLDKRLDLIRAQDVYYQTADREFEPALTLRNTIYTGVVPHENQNVMVSQPNLVDFNGDGILDTYRVEVTAAKLSPRTDVSIYLGRENRTFPEQPDLVLRTRDFAYSDVIPVGDVNGDGALDMALFHLDFQASSANSQLKAYLRNGLEGSLRFYLWDKAKNRFPEGHDFGFPVMVNYDIYGARQFFRQQVTVSSDMTGDNRPDLVLKTGAQQISIFENLADKPGFNSRAAATISTSPTRFSSLAVSDLNGDKRGDVVVSGYVEGQDDRVIYSLFLSK